MKSSVWSSRKQNLWTRNHFETKSLDQVDDVVNISSVSFHFIPCHEILKMEEANSLFVKLVLEIMSGIEKLLFVNIQILHILNLEIQKCF